MAWQETFQAGRQPSLKSKPNDELHAKERKIEQLHRKIGEMTMEVLKRQKQRWSKDVWNSLVWSSPNPERKDQCSEATMVRCSLQGASWAGVDNTGFAMRCITPYTPRQNGMIERVFQSMKEECVWLQRFDDFAQAKSTVARWIRFYNEERPHQALGYRSPVDAAPKRRAT